MPASAPASKKSSFFPGHRDRLLMPRGLLRVRRIHPVPGRGQRLHPRPPLSLDHDHHLRRVRLAALTRAPRDQIMEPGHPRRPRRQQPPAQHPPARVLHHHMMMVISPVIPDEQHPPCPFPLRPVIIRQQQGEPPAT
jgi:hypothetical protein